MSVSTLLNGILDINVKNMTTNSVKNAGELYIQGTTIFQNNNHIGQVVIQTGAVVSAPIPINKMNNDAIILIASKQPNTGIWAVPINDSFTVHTSIAVIADTIVDYFVLKAD